MTLVVGLTGGIATGKSTISGMFQQLNIPVVDADKIAREVVEPGKKAYNEIVNTFGESILHEDGTLDRKGLGSIVFNDKDKLKLLNNIVHPEIREEMKRQKNEHIEAGASCIILDIPLLFENNLQGLVNKVLVVFVDENVQLERLMERDNSTEEEALNRIQSQIPITKKIEKADATINNNGTVEQSYEQLINVLEQWNIAVEKQ